jgi:CheY-like chemotaxis protein
LTVNKARELRPDIILMDIGLKGEMDGIEAATKINSIYDTPNIYITAYTDSEWYEAENGHNETCEVFFQTFSGGEPRKYHSVCNE